MGKYYSKECFRGKIGRKEYIFVNLLILSISIPLQSFLIYPTIEDGGILYMLLPILSLPLLLGSFIKRWHDIGVYGAWKLLGLIILDTITLKAISLSLVFVSSKQEIDDGIWRK